MNHGEAKAFVLVVHLPLLVRGHSVVTRVLDDIISVRVPNIYRVQLGLPLSIHEDNCRSYFDCKIRRLFVTLPVKQPEPEAAPEVEEAPEVFESHPEVPMPQQEPSAADDLLFDVM